MKLPLLTKLITRKVNPIAAISYTQSINVEEKRTPTSDSSHHYNYRTYVEIGFNQIVSQEIPERFIADRGTRAIMDLVYGDVYNELAEITRSLSQKIPYEVDELNRLWKMLDVLRGNV